MPKFFFMTSTRRNGGNVTFQMRPGTVEKKLLFLYRFVTVSGEIPVLPP